MLTKRLLTLRPRSIPLKRNLSTEPNASSTSKTARAARRVQASQESSSPLLTPARAITGATVLTLGLISYAVYDINENPDGVFSKMYASSGLQDLINWLRAQVSYGIADVLEPSSDKLIPDFPDPSFYGPTPPGAVAPPLLVVDLERTLIGSVYGIYTG
jgi:hypothetical protein